LLSNATGRRKTATVVTRSTADGHQWHQAAVADIAKLEAAAKRAHVAAQLLLEKEALMAMGSAGGTWGSKARGPVLQEALQLTRVGMVERVQEHEPPASSR
jgi:hypothetical protein